MFLCISVFYVFFYLCIFVVTLARSQVHVSNKGFFCVFGVFVWYHCAGTKSMYHQNVYLFSCVFCVLTLCRNQVHVSDKCVLVSLRFCVFVWQPCVGASSIFKLNVSMFICLFKKKNILCRSQVHISAKCVFVY